MSATTPATNEAVRASLAAASHVLDVADRLGIEVCYLTASPEGAWVTPDGFTPQAEADALADALALPTATRKDFGGWVREGGFGGVTVTIREVTPPAPVCGCGVVCDHKAAS